MAKTTINPALLYSALDAARQERGVSWRALAKEIGVSPSLLSRLGSVSRLWRRPTGVPAPIVVPAG